MAQRLYGYAVDIFGNTYDLKVHDRDWAGGLTSVIISRDIIDITWKSVLNAHYSPLITSKFDLSILITDATLQTFVEDVRRANEERFTVEVYKNGNLFSIGNVLTDKVVMEDANWPYYFNLACTDGIAKLKTVEYDLHEGYETYLVQLRDILGLLSISQFYGSQPMIRIALKWRESRHDPAGDPFALTRFQARAQYTYESADNVTKPTAYEMLYSMMEDWVATLHFADGFWWVIHQECIGDDTLNFFEYSFDLQTVNQGSIFRDKSIKLVQPGSDFPQEDVEIWLEADNVEEEDQIDIGTLLRKRGGQQSALSGLLYTESTYNHFSNQNLIPFGDLAAGEWSLDIPSQGGAVKLSIGFNVQWTFNPGYDLSQPYYIFFRLLVRLGSDPDSPPNPDTDCNSCKFFIRELVQEFGNNFLTVNDSGWKDGDAGTYKYYDFTMYYNPQWPTSGNTQHFTIVSDSVPVDGNVFIKLEPIFILDNVFNQVDAAGSAGSAVITNPLLQLRTPGVVDDLVLTTIYRTTNDNPTGLSDFVAIETFVGDGPNDASWGALEIWDPGVPGYVKSSNWLRDGAGSFEFGDLQTLALIYKREATTPVLMGQFIGYVAPHYRIIYDLTVWVAINVSNNVREGDINGRWFEVDTLIRPVINDPKVPGVIASGGLEPEIPLDDTDLIQLVPGAGVPVDAANVTYITQELTEGANITQLSVNDTPVEIVQAGAILTVVNAATGQAQDFEVETSAIGTGTVNTIDVVDQVANHFFHNKSKVYITTLNLAKSGLLGGKSIYTGSGDLSQDTVVEGTPNVTSYKLEFLRLLQMVLDVEAPTREYSRITLDRSYLFLEFFNNVDPVASVLLNAFGITLAKKVNIDGQYFLPTRKPLESGVSGVITNAVKETLFYTIPHATINVNVLQSQVLIVPVNEDTIEAISFEFITNVAGFSYDNATNEFVYNGTYVRLTINLILLANFKSSTGTNDYTEGWRYDNNTANSDPGNGDFRFDAANPSLALAMNISVRATGNINTYPVLAELQTGDTIYIEDKNNSANNLTYTVGNPIDNTTYFRITISLVSANGTFTNNTECDITLTLASSYIRFDLGVALNGSFIDRSLESLFIDASLPIQNINTNIITNIELKTNDRIKFAYRSALDGELTIDRANIHCQNIQDQPLLSQMLDTFPFYGIKCDLTPNKYITFNPSLGLVVKAQYPPNYEDFTNPNHSDNPGIGYTNNRPHFSFNGSNQYFSSVDPNLEFGPGTGLIAFNFTHNDPDNAVDEYIFGYDLANAGTNSDNVISVRIDNGEIILKVYDSVGTVYEASVALAAGAHNFIFTFDLTFGLFSAFLDNFGFGTIFPVSNTFTGFNELLIGKANEGNNFEGTLEYFIQVDGNASDSVARLAEYSLHMLS